MRRPRNVGVAAVTVTTAIVPPSGKDRGGFRIIIVAASNADPYPRQAAAIAALGAHFGVKLDRDRCPLRR